MRNSIIAFAAAALLALPGAVSGQNTAQIDAIATVVAPIDVTAGVDLDFGVVLPGVPTQVLPVDGGTFTVSGAVDQDVIVDFTLPATLTAGAALTMPVSFDAGYGAGAPDTALDPTSDVTVGLGASGGWDVFLGGTVLPAVDQGAGSYSGTVTLTVAYPAS